MNKEKLGIELSGYIKELMDINSEWELCYNCKFCWKVNKSIDDIKESIIECTWLQEDVEGLKLSDTCAWHIFNEDYLKIFEK